MKKQTITTIHLILLCDWYSFNFASDPFTWYMMESSSQLTCCNLQFKTDIVFKMHREKMHGEIFQKPKWLLRKIDHALTTGVLSLGDGGKTNSKKEQVYFHTSTILICPHCGMQTSSPKILGQHIRMLHTGAFHKCSNCEYQSRRKGDIKLHYMRRHTEQLNTTCQFCGKLFKEIKDHLKTTMCGKDEDDREKTTCEQCGKIVQNRNKLQHIKLVHNIVKDKKCTQCSYVTYSNFNLRLHVSKVHMGKSLEYENCPHCSKITSNMKRHLNIYHNEHLSNE